MHNYMRRLLSFLILLLALSLTVRAQEDTELNCEVEINTEKVPNANKEIFNTLKTAISEYLNNTKWTDAHFMVNEKIQCKLLLVVSKYEDAGGAIAGELTIQSQRPVYNSSYTTTVINYKDTKVDFSYNEGEQLVFSETDMISNLTAILNFWAYTIIAMDFDTFSPRGGDPYYEKAANIVRLAQSSGETGWKAFEDSRNRSAVLSAFTDKQTSALRQILYDYHRQGLDQMVVSVDKGRAVVSQCLEELKKVFDVAPMSVGLVMFKDAKLDELVNIYSKAGTSEKQNVYDILYPIYPSDQSRLEKIKEVSNDF